MIIKIYALRDDKAQSFLTPMFFKNDAMAMRAIAQLCNDSRNGFIFTNPEDYLLYTLGEYDDQTGVLTSDIHHIIKVIDLRKVSENEQGA